MQHIIHLIAAARPNFMKIAPLYHALVETNWAEPVIVHTGQHYDLNIPCLTLRENTERPITVTQGTNQLCTIADLQERVQAILDRKRLQPPRIELWDGQTASRVVDSIQAYFCG